jgi:hypothetical protein
MVQPMLIFILAPLNLFISKATPAKSDHAEIYFRKLHKETFIENGLNIKVNTGHIIEQRPINNPLR